MALVPITHVYDTLSVINNTGLLDGQILYTTDQTVNKIFADVKVNNILRRIEIGGTNTIDTELNQESGHAIANSAVAKLAQTVHTNLLNPTLGTTTRNGVTCTANDDGTYTLNGTATGWAKFAVGTISIKGGVTYLASGCPSGGSYDQTNAYRIGVFNVGESDAFANDIGNGKTFKSDVGKNIVIGINIAPQTTVTNLTFKPMLTTDLSATYDDYVPYSGNGELNENVADLYKGLESTDANLATTNTNLTALDTKVGAQSLLPTPSQSVTQNINTLKAEINQLNSDLSASSGTDIFTPATGVTVANNTTTKNGTMVMLSLNIDCSNVTTTGMEAVRIGTVSLLPAFNIRSFAMGYSSATDAGTCIICDVGKNGNVNLLHMAGKKYAVIYVCYLI